MAPTLHILALVACVVTTSAWQMPAAAPLRTITGQPQPAVCPVMFGGGRKAAPKKVVKQAVKKVAPPKKAVKKAVAKPAAKASSPFSGLFGAKATPAAKKPLPKKVVKQAVKKVTPPPRKVVKKVVKKVAAAPKKRVFKTAAAKKPAASPFAALFAPKAPAAKKPAFKKPLSKPKPASKPAPKPPSPRNPSQSKTTPGTVLWMGNGQRTVVPAKPVRPPPRPPPPPRPQYSADVNPQRRNPTKQKSAPDDGFSPLPLLGATAGAVFLTTLASAPPPPPPSGGGDLVLPVLAFTVLAGLAAFIFTGDEAKTEAAATPPTLLPMPDDAGTDAAPAEAPTEAVQPAAETAAAPPS